jgi:DNA-binding NarL/FixJ family response regulator
MSVIRNHTVLLIDAEPVSQLGLAQLIQKDPNYRVCGQAESLGRGRELCVQFLPTLVVLDLALGDGLGFVRDLPQWSPHSRVIIYTALMDVIMVQRAFKAGVYGYVSRKDPLVAVSRAVSGALIGERHVGPAVEEIMLGNLANGGLQVKPEGRGGLTNRELQVVEHFGRGLSAREAATLMNLSIKTIETHSQRIKEKLGLKSIAALRHYAASPDVLKLD